MVLGGKIGAIVPWRDFQLAVNSVAIGLACWHNGEDTAQEKGQELSL